MHSDDHTALSKFLQWLVHRHAGFWETCGNVETRLLQKKLAAVRVEAPVYITALARAGTTVLLEILQGHPSCVSHRYRDFYGIYTPVLAEKFFGMLGGGAAPLKERPHGDGILINPDSPEAMEEILWMHWFPHLHQKGRCSTLEAESRNPAFDAFYRDHIRKLLLARGGGRYVCKNNYNVNRIGYLASLFPDARFILPVRHPVAHVESLMRQHANFAARLSSPAQREYLRMAGHFEFGADAVAIALEEGAPELKLDTTAQSWARYWNAVYGWQQRHVLGNAALQQRCLSLRFEALCASPEESVRAVFRHAGLELAEDEAKAYAARLGSQRKYASQLSEADRNAVWEICGETAALYGYAP